MEQLIIFGILSVPVIILSWHTLFNVKSHGFYRFFSWECIVWLAVSNYSFWFVHPLSPGQIFSWIFLILSGYLAIAGTVLLKKAGKPGEGREEKNLYSFEKTSTLVDRGIYKYIRHPLYASLIFLTWGILLKQVSAALLIIALTSTAFLFLTALLDERECIRFFGESYRAYMKRSKRFIPFII